MTSSVIFLEPITIAFVLGTLLLPAGLALAVVKRKKAYLRNLGLLLAVLSIYPCVVMAPAYLWQFDLLRGWELHLPIQTSSYRISLVQFPHRDFYSTRFEIETPDGKMATIYIDGDDNRWWNPDLVERAGRIYFVRGFGPIDERTSYFDTEDKTIFSGYQETFALADLEFK